GIGLSLSEKIIHLHKGNIAVRSEIGKGSTFIVKLPKDK
ncbi:ATP-binding protein, partial [Pseudomonas aeruginosa]